MALAPIAPISSSLGTHFDCDVAIVGGGIAGVTLACALQDSGMKVLIIEAKPPAVAAARDRSYAISLLSGRILDGIGVWQAIFPHIAKFRTIRLSDGDRQPVWFRPQDLGTEYLGYVAQHRVLLEALQQCTTRSPNISWLSPAEVTAIADDEAGVNLQIDAPEGRQQVRSRVLVGADGARSRVREAAGIRTWGWHYWQSCVTTTFRHEAKDNETAFERFWPSGPMGVLPLPQNRCQVVWTAPHERAKALQAQDLSSFTAQLERHTGGLLGRLEVDSDRLVFPVQLMQSQRYVQPRLALVADAAHCCHPVGGQGLNLGIRDVAALAQILQTGWENGEDIGSDRLLKRYQRWRKLENLAILGFTDILDRMFSNEWLPAVALRSAGLWTMGQVSPLRVLSLRLMTGMLGRTPTLAKQLVG